MRLIEFPAVAMLMVAGGLACVAALACGPEFEQLLTARQQTLAAPIGYDFGRAARHLGQALQPAPLAPSPAAFAALSDTQSAGDRDSAVARLDGLSQAQADKILALRAAANGDEAFADELAPDGAVMDGNFQIDAAPPAVGRQATSAEVARFRHSGARPGGRFHYRGQAALLATKAADDLPPRSQAYAAVLCRAAGWTLDHQPDIAHAIYLRYLHTGASFPWASHFGIECPEPDFRHTH